MCQWMACEYKHSDGSANENLPAPTGLPTRPPPPNFYMLIFRNHKTPPESRMKTTLLIHMETSTTSTIPAVINSPVLFGRQYLRMLTKKMRRGEAETLHLTTWLAQPDPSQHTTPSIRYSQSSKKKGRGVGPAPALHSDATCDSGNSCTLGNAPASSQLGKRCASSSLRAPAANPLTLFGQPIAHD